jgi:hypothetical protein
LCPIARMTDPYRRRKGSFLFAAQKVVVGT